MRDRLSLAVLASGEGTTFEAIAEAISGGHLAARIALLVADRPGAGALERARRRGLPTAVIASRHRDPEEWAAELTRTLQSFEVELVVNAGWLAILPPSWNRTWYGRAINLHPSLLPKYGGRGMYGHPVHAAVLAAREVETGVTVHLVTDAIDRGPILLQRRVPVLATDTPETLRERLRPVEQELLLEAIRRFADGRWPLPYVPSEDRASSRDVRRTRDG